MPYNMSLEPSAKLSTSLKQTQRLMLSREMQQALKVLQLPIVELMQSIEAELEINPVLEIHEEESEEPHEKNSFEGKEVRVDENDFSILQKMDEEFSDLMTDQPRVPRTHDDASKEAFRESLITDTLSLYEFLLQQVIETFSQPEDINIANILLGYLDNHGFLTNSLAEIAETFHLEEKKLEKILTILKTLDPPGIFAKNLQESLLIQMERKNQKNSLSYTIVESFFEDLLHNRLESLAKALKHPLKDINDALHAISRLTFQPAASYSEASPHYIVPDIIFEDLDGALEIRVNQDPLPPLRLNHKYLRMLKNKDIASETKKFIEDKISKAKWLVRTIDQRNSTLHRIAEHLYQMNKDFFLLPEGQLKPLTMKTLAKDLDVHESTIARAVANKYVSCARGTLPLRSFFTSSFATDEGLFVSSHTIKNVIRDLIDQEDKKHPLSDEKISQIIQAKGIPCARRTVAKFRASLGFGNTHQRKKFF